MKIGVTPRFEKSKNGETRFSFEESVLNFLLKLTEPDDILFLNPNSLKIPNGIGLLVIPGGDTPGENFIRDNFEKQLIAQARKNGTKILGICRGAQLLAVIDNAQLVQIKGHVNQYRNLVNRTEFQGRCFHNWAILDMPSNWEILARDKIDNSIEIFGSKNRIELGIMSHPERSDNYSDMAKMIGDFLSVL